MNNDLNDNGLSACQRCEEDVNDCGECTPLHPDHIPESNSFVARPILTLGLLVAALSLCTLSLLGLLFYIGILP